VTLQDCITGVMRFKEAKRIARCLVSASIWLAELENTKIENGGILIPELNKRSLPGLWLLSWSVLQRLVGATLTL
jgi:hypothetical protein